MKGSTPPYMAAGLNFDFEKQWSELPLPTKPIALLAGRITYNILGNKQVSEFRTIDDLLQIVDGFLQTTERLLQTVDGLLLTTQRLLQIIDGLLEAINGYHQPSNG